MQLTVQQNQRSLLEEGRKPQSTIHSFPQFDTSTNLCCTPGGGDSWLFGAMCLLSLIDVGSGFTAYVIFHGNFLFLYLDRSNGMDEMTGP